MAPRVLISDALSPAAVQIFKDRGIEVDFQPKLGADKDGLAQVIGDFDGLAIRSATKVTPKVLEKAKRLKVIGRAGIGVDNVDIPAATAKGVIVMNTPFGNSITTAEHAITLMLALARQIPQADASTQAGKWEKNRFMGVEITNKTLGVIGCGNVGSIVVNRAIGLKMKVVAYDPFLSPEPAAENPLFGHPNVVCTPHLGAATTEAQENVALQIAEQMSDYLLRGAISNAVNFPSISAEEAPRLRPFIELAEKLGSFAGQLTETGILKAQLSYEGDVAGMNTKALTSAAIAGLLRPMLQEVNVVSAPSVAKERGIVIEEVTREAAGDYESLITVTVVTTRQTRWVSGTVYADGRPRIVNIKGIRMDAEFGHSMIYITNLDKPGFIGKFSSTLGDAGINIATFHVGREGPGASAIALIEIDGELPSDVLAKVRALPQVQQARPLKF